MNRDQAIGAVLLVASLVGVAYAWLLCVYSFVILQIAAFIAVGSLLAGVLIMRWAFQGRREDDFEYLLTSFLRGRTHPCL